MVPFQLLVGSLSSPFLYALNVDLGNRCLSVEKAASLESSDHDFSLDSPQKFPAVSTQPKKVIIDQLEAPACTGLPLTLTPRTGPP